MVEQIVSSNSCTQNKITEAPDSSHDMYIGITWYNINRCYEILHYIQKDGILTEAPDLTKILHYIFNKWENNNRGPWSHVIRYYITYVLNDRALTDWGSWPHVINYYITYMYLYMYTNPWPHVYIDVHFT